MIQDYDKTRAVCAELFDERVRQTSVKGWSVDHDDVHENGEIASAGTAYAMHAANELSKHPIGIGQPPAWWPWGAEAWTPKNPRRDLIRAAALIVAEIERLDRASAATQNPKASP